MTLMRIFRPATRRQFELKVPGDWCAVVDLCNREFGDLTKPMTGPELPKVEQARGGRK